MSNRLTRDLIGVYSKVLAPQNIYLTLEYQMDPSLDLSFLKVKKKIEASQVYMVVKLDCSNISFDKVRL